MVNWDGTEISVPVYYMIVFKPAMGRLWYGAADAAAVAAATTLGWAGLGSAGQDEGDMTGEAESSCGCCYCCWHN